MLRLITSSTCVIKIQRIARKVFLVQIGLLRTPYTFGELILEPSESSSVHFEI